MNYSPALTQLPCHNANNFTVRFAWLRGLICHALIGCLIVLVSVVITTLSASAQAQATSSCNSYTDYLRGIAQFESSLNPAVVNQYGYLGAFQMGKPALIDAGFMRADGSWTGQSGVRSQADFLGNPDAQVIAITNYYQRVNGYIDNLGLRQYIGQTINGIPVTASGILAGAHLVGVGGLRDWLRSGGTVVPRDGNGTPITRYVASFGGCTNMSGPAPAWSQIANGTTANPTPGTLPPGSGILTGLPGTGGTVIPTGTGGINPFSVSGTTASAFNNATGGVPLGNFRLFVASLFICLLILVIALSYTGTLKGWTRGYVGQITLSRTLLGGAVLLSISIWLVTI